MRDRKRQKKGPDRKGVWEEIARLEETDSGLTLIISERIRGKVSHSIQIVHVDQMGPNKHIPIPAPGAKHALRDIVYSLVARAEETIAKRAAELAGKGDGN